MSNITHLHGHESLTVHVWGMCEIMILVYRPRTCILLSKHKLLPSQQISEIAGQWMVKQHVNADPISLLMWITTIGNLWITLHTGVPPLMSLLQTKTFVHSCLHIYMYSWPTLWLHSAKPLNHVYIELTNSKGTATLELWGTDRITNVCILPASGYRRSFATLLGGDGL